VSHVQQLLSSNERPHFARVTGTCPLGRETFGTVRFRHAPPLLSSSCDRLCVPSSRQCGRSGCRKRLCPAGGSSLAPWPPSSCQCARREPRYAARTPLQEEHAMNHPEKVIYTAKVHTTGGRVGASRRDDGRLEVKLSRPRRAPAPTRSSCSRPAGRPATSRRWSWWRAE
jgi:hypothetical protein